MDLSALLSLPQDGLLVFLLLFVRFSAMLLLAPLFSQPQLPVRIRVALALMISMVLLPLELHAPHARPAGLDGLLVAVAGEATVGIMLGFVAMLVFQAVSFAGYLIGLQMGFGMDSMYDPGTNQSVPALAVFLGVIASMVFLLADGHHYLLLALDHSLRVVPLGTFRFSEQTMTALMNATAGMFTTVFELVLPVLGVLLLTEVALAIMNRVMPQMNVFVAGFPLKIALGFLTIAIGLPLMVAYLDDAFGRMTRELLMLFG